MVLVRIITVMIIPKLLTVLIFVELPTTATIGLNPNDDDDCDVVKIILWYLAVCTFELTLILLPQQR